MASVTKHRLRRDKYETHKLKLRGGWDYRCFSTALFTGLYKSGIECPLKAFGRDTDLLTHPDPRFQANVQSH